MQRLLALGLVALAGPSFAAAQQPQADVLTLARDNNAFALDLYRRLSAREGNLFFSPYSISSALAMTCAGARGETADQMARTLHFTLGPDRLHPAFAALGKEIHGSQPADKFELHVANALWGQQRFPFRPEYLRLTADQYGAGLRLVDFNGGPDVSRQIINDWVEGQTKGKIKDLLPESVIDTETRLVLTNAVYLKADWLAAFREEDTKDAPFFLTAQHNVLVPMMYRELTTRYYQDDLAQVAELPYRHRRWSMLLVLPRRADGLAGVERAFTAPWLEKRVGAPPRGRGAALRPVGDERAGEMTEHRVRFTLPRFRLQGRVELRDELARLGLRDLFSDRANFSGMTEGSERLKLKEVVHQAFVQIDEAGTEAATAAVAVRIVSDDAPPPPVNFRADRPFLIAIRDNTTGTLLFLGRVTDPRGEK